MFSYLSKTIEYQVVKNTCLLAEALRGQGIVSKVKSQIAETEDQTDGFSAITSLVITQKMKIPDRRIRFGQQ